MAALGLMVGLGLHWTVDAQAGPPLTIVNALPPSPVCDHGNTVSLFTPGQQVIQPGGHSLTVDGSFATFPGIGIQVNNWYWTATSLPVQKEHPQNPDNSGGQFAVSDQCVCHDNRPGTGKASRHMSHGHPNNSQNRGQGVGMLDPAGQNCTT